MGKRANNPPARRTWWPSPMAPRDVAEALKAWDSLGDLARARLWSWAESSRLAEGAWVVPPEDPLHPLMLRLAEGATPALAAAMLASPLWLHRNVVLHLLERLSGRPDLLRRVAERYADKEILNRVATHPDAPQDLLRGLADPRRPGGVVWGVFASPNVPADVIKAALQAHPSSSLAYFMVSNYTANPGADPELLREVLASPAFRHMVDMGFTYSNALRIMQNPRLDARALNEMVRSAGTWLAASMLVTDNPRSGELEDWVLIAVCLEESPGAAVRAARLLAGRGYTMASETKGGQACKTT